MQTLLDYAKAAPGSVQATYKPEKCVDKTMLEHSLLELVNTRVSQINGCAFCIDVHTKDARAAGETEQRLYGLSGWREAPYYSERERAALAWAEAVTLISQTRALHEEFEAARAQFSEEELVQLTIAIISINGWNRLAIAFRPQFWKYQARAKAE